MAIKNVRLIASKENWIEGEAVRQLEQTATRPGMIRAVGLPDLHPGKGHPIGAAFLTKGVIYPALVGNDIGCGMGLWKTDIPIAKNKIDKWVRKLGGLEREWEGDSGEWLSRFGVDGTLWKWSLGTIGGGNHFAELQVAEEVLNPEVFQRLGLEKDRIMLLVHSGSRGLGEEVLKKHLPKSGALEASGPEAQAYIKDHENAVGWAKANRALIARRFLALIGAEGSMILDLTHNSVSQVEWEGASHWVHRKGAAPSDQGAVVIPGSRGALSYLVEPLGEQRDNLFSVAHGAGRKWSRQSAKGRLEDRYDVQSLQKTDLGSVVICEDKDLIFEEAPQAYKNIDIVVSDLVAEKLVQVIATFKPILTYKVKR